MNVMTAAWNAYRADKLIVGRAFNRNQFAMYLRHAHADSRRRTTFAVFDLSLGASFGRGVIA